MNNIITNKILDLFFPRFCIGCDSYIEEFQDQTAYICEKCSEKIRVPEIQKCAFCDNATQNGATCLFCKREKYLDQLIVATDFSLPVIKNSIHKFKYESIKLLAQDLGMYLDLAFNKHYKKERSPQNTLIVPIPLHWTRKNWRGYNQAELLIENTKLGSLFEINTKLLKRNFQFEHQAELQSRQRRQQNTENIFFVKGNENKIFENKNIILIDDVSTTGSTLNSASKILKQKGAKYVCALVLARNNYNENSSK